MTKWDRNNLNFLLGLDDAGMTAWAEQATQDDFDYARELFNTHRTELELAALDKIDELAVNLGEVGDYLKKFQLK